MKVTKSESVDGRKLITVSLRHQTADAAAPMFEAVYEVFLPSGLLTESPGVLFPLSVTRTDTREAVTLDADERKEASEAAVEYMASMTRDD
jgi:hypothetical protein